MLWALHVPGLIEYAMSLTVSDIIQIPALRTRLIGGAQGLNQPVRWAHVCELDDPAQWLGPGELLMSTGMGIPVGPEEQWRYIKRLQAAGLAGLMIGEGMQAPEDLQGLQDAADALGFALLLTEYGVPFSSVTRAVVEAAQQQEVERRQAIARLYESARMGIQGLGLEALLKRLEKDVKASLRLLDPQTLEPYLAGLPEVVAAQRTALQQRLKPSGNVPVVQRWRSDDNDVLLMLMPSRRPCVLVAQGEDLPDYGLLHHMAAVLGIELERLQVERERHLRLTSELLDDLFQQRLSAGQLAERLRGFGASPEHLRVAVMHNAGRELAELDDLLSRTDAKVLMRVQGDELILLLWGEHSPRIVQARLHQCLGLSNPLGHAERGLEALREARLALAHASTEQPLACYEQTETMAPWLAQSLEGAQQTFQRVLGSLLEYDQLQGTQLLRTLQVFLQQNRSWLIAAKALHVHKQTLVYRIRRIEEITGRSLDHTEDVAILWFALRSAEVAGLHERIAGFKE